MPGPRPTPSNLVRLRGNPGKRAPNDDEPQPEAKLPPCPKTLQGEARREWFRMGKQLLGLGLVTEIDKAALSLYCTAWGRYADAEAQLQQYGTVIIAPSGFPVQSPYLAIANKALEQCRRLLIEFGMSPSSRSRVRASKAGPDVDPADVFLNSKPRRA